MVPDENSMEDSLCNSSFGSMVSLDYVTPDTRDVANQSYGQYVVQQWGQLADKNRAARRHERRTQEGALQTERSSGFIQTWVEPEKEATGEGPFEGLEKVKGDKSKIHVVYG